jgi:YhcH/YjgK/YiaL family protein
VGEGTFVILFPQDGHMPGMAISTPQPVKKFVVKVAISD